MVNKQQLNLEEIIDLQELVSKKWLDYWQQFSHFGTWQFWVNLSMFIIPLAILFYKIDRKRAILLGFYGINFNLYISYIVSYGLKNGLWAFPFHFFPFLPENVSLDSSLIPVSFILMYQWTLNKGKNYYVYSIILGAVFSFIFKPLLTMHNMFQMYKWVNYFHIFLVYVFVIFLSKWVTNLFIYLEKEEHAKKSEKRF
ncbi:MULTISPECIES: hypothetical protein [Bacillus]|uniref:hypothetical protein n=1 Tax=Bacillus TaxID=1386 RepID=UPI000BB9B3C3|nr:MULTISPECIES: hypothetical protein [Bacillus]